MNNVDINNFKTINDVEQYRKMINEACDSRVEFIQLCLKASNLEGKSFLYLKEAFENMSPKLFESEEGKKVISKYTNVVKNTNNLKNLHSLYENIRKASKAVDTDYFVKNITDVNWNVNPKTLSEDMKKLGRIVAEGYLTIGADADNLMPVERAELSNSVEYIAENKKSHKNITEYSEAVKVIRESIEKQDEMTVIENKSMTSIAESLIKEFNDKYSDKLSDKEKTFIKEVSSQSKTNVFENLKKACLDKLSSEKEKETNQETINRLNTISEQVNNKTFSEKTYIDDVCSLYEMINVFE